MKYANLAPQFRPGGTQDPKWMDGVRKLLAGGVASVEPQIVIDLFEYYDALKPKEVSTAWASPTLGRAHLAIEKLRDDLAQPSESGIDEALRGALDAIELADTELVGLA